MGAPAASAPAAPAARREGEGERSRAEEAWRERKRERMGGRGPRGPDALDLFGGFFLGPVDSLQFSRTLATTILLV